MRLAEFITTSSAKIISEWEQFALLYVDAASTLDIEARRDHVAAMLEVIAVDMQTPQTKREQASKSKGTEDGDVHTVTAATLHGADRAATGYSPTQMAAEFRALRASVLRLWGESQPAFDRQGLEEVTRFNEAVDQLLAESLGKYAHDVQAAHDLFLGVLGHDLRNPLGAIMTSASLMMVKEGADWPQARTASRILSSGNRMDGMIRDLLDFTRSRLGSGIPVARADMDMAEVCRQTVDEFVAFHPHCEVQLESTGKVRGEWDGARIAQALSNLVGNAYQHGRADTPMTVGVRGGPDAVTVWVHNEGDPIEPSKLKEIFNPFRQLAPGVAKSRDVRSAGLGLYIVQAIVTAHDGSIEVGSSERGTTFTMRFPRRVPST